MTYIELVNTIEGSRYRAGSVDAADYGPHLFEGVPTAAAEDYPTGALAVDTVAGKLYINTGDDTSATWTVVGAQTA